MTTATGRGVLMAHVSRVMAEAGYTVVTKRDNDLHILKEGISLGYLDFRGVSLVTNPERLSGRVTLWVGYVSAFGRGGRGTYKLTDSTINLPGLLARLKAIFPLAKAAKAARENIEALSARDAKLRRELASEGTFPKSVSSFEVYEGLTTVKLSGLSFAEAMKVMALARTFDAERT